MDRNNYDRNNNDRNNETQSFPRQPDRPRQVFPEPGDYPPRDYQQDYQPEYQEPREEKTSGGVIALAILAGLALLAAGVMFFLWRSAAADADKPAPPPVTSTVTTTQPTTVTETVTDNPSPEDWLPSDVPSIPPLPSDVQNFDVEQWFRDTFGLDSGAPTGEPQPAQ